MSVEAQIQKREFHLISAPFSCGVSWLVSVLTELNVRATHACPARYLNGFWQPVPDRPGCERIAPEGVSHMRYYLPVLQERNEFRLQPGVEVFWEHFLSFARRTDRPVLLFVRDPRDAIHSLYQRNYRAISFTEYLDRPEVWPDHFPGMFQLPPAETWAAWHAMWLGLDGLLPIKILRFEHSREAPVGLVQEVLASLGVRREDAEIARAVERSSFAKTKAAMERAEAESGQPFRVARRGQIGEWRECFTPEELRRFGGPTAEWMRRFGYSPARESEACDPSAYGIDLSALPTELIRCSQKACRAFEAGDLGQAKWTLKQGLQAEGGGEPGRLFLGCDWVALDWTEKVLGDQVSRQPLANLVFKAFRGFNFSYAQWPSIRTMLLGAVGAASPPGSDFFARLSSPSVLKPRVERAAEEPVSKTQPLLVESDFHGFDLYGWAGRFYALARTARDLDWKSLTQPEISSHRKQGRLFVADLSFELREAVQEHLARRGK